MSKRTKARPPMLIMRHLHNTDLEIKELVAVRAFQLGAAQKSHYDLLLDLTNMLLLAGSSDDSREYAKTKAETVYIPALRSIRDRWEKTGKLGVNAQELRTLLELVEFSKQFWNRQPIALYQIAGRELQAYYNDLAEKRRA